MSPKLEDYEVLSVIGKGTSGTCYKVRHKLTNLYYVWKAVNYEKLSEDQKKNLVVEVNLLSQLNHPNIVKYYDRVVHHETATLYIITEWCQGGDLAQVISDAKSSGKRLKEEVVWKILYQVSRAVQVCHTQLIQFTVLHRDIKPANVFLDELGNAKLGDFGLARTLESGDECSGNLVGTPSYMSPEVIKGGKYNRKSDIWALGCLVYELCCLSPPFVGPTLRELYKKIKAGMYNPIPSCYSENLGKIVSWMLSERVELRPTIEMVLHHPIVVQNVKTSQKQRHTPKTMLEVCQDALKNLSMTTQADIVTENTFKEKWLHRLESLREREARLRKKEEEIMAKERSLHVKEKHLALRERQTMERIALADVYLHRKKVTHREVSDPDTDFSADPGDTSILPTTAKLNLNYLPARKLPTSRRSRVTFSSSKENIQPDSVPTRSQPALKPNKGRSNTFRLVHFI